MYRMHLLSIGKNTVLSEFDTLNQLSVYVHGENESRDFQFYASAPVFIEVDKMKSLEVLRIKQNILENNAAIEIQRVRKLNIDNVYSVACSKRSVEEMALGLSTGCLKVYNYKNSQFVHTFKPLKLNGNKTCVLYADYNASDDYISSVLENGEVYVYGIKTKTLTDTINIDKNSIMARFHPSKRFHLAITSQKGGVTIFDIQSKRKLFTCPDSHSAPCRDVAMSIGAPDTMISVGYDCGINIYDTRKKSHIIKLSYTYPMSTVTMSNCGMYFAVGNLKGEVITFDTRNTKVNLNQNKLHDCAVGRVAFVPKQDDRSMFDLANGIIQSVGNINKNEKCEYGADSGNSNDSPSKSSMRKLDRHRDSFDIFIKDMDIDNDAVENTDSPSQALRESFDWNMLNPTAAKETTTSDENGNQFQFINTSRGCGRYKNHHYIREFRSNSSCPERMSTSDLKVKENTLADIVEEVFKSEDSANVAPVNNSYEKLLKEEEREEELKNCEKDIDDLEPDTGTGYNDVSHSIEEHPPEYRGPYNVKENFNCRFESIIIREIRNLREEMNNRFRYLEGEIKFNAEQNKWQIFTQNSKIWGKQQNSTESINKTLNFMMQTDPFVTEYVKIKEENALLKAKLAKLEKNLRRK